MSKKTKSQCVVVVEWANWIRLVTALSASPDIAVDDLVLKVERLVQSKQKLAQKLNNSSQGVRQQ